MDSEKLKKTPVPRSLSHWPSETQLKEAGCQIRSRRARLKRVPLRMIGTDGETALEKQELSTLSLPFP